MSKGDFSVAVSMALESELHIFPVLVELKNDRVTMAVLTRDDESQLDEAKEYDLRKSVPLEQFLAAEGMALQSLLPTAKPYLRIGIFTRVQKRMTVDFSSEENLPESWQAALAEGLAEQMGEELPARLRQRMWRDAGKQARAARSAPSEVWTAVNVLDELAKAFVSDGERSAAPEPEFSNREKRPA